MTDAYRTVRADLVQKRDQLDAVIAALTTLIGDGSSAAVVAAADRARPRGSAPPKSARRQRVSRPTVKVSTRTARKVIPAASEATAPRDAAILDYLKLHDGIATRKLLKAAMPKEVGLSEEQRQAAYRNTMSRLKAKGLVDRTGDTWSMVGIGSNGQ